MDTLVLIALGVVLIILLGVITTESFIDDPHAGTYTYDTGLPGPKIGILAGIHGNEPAASLELERMIHRDWFRCIKNGSVLIIPKANPFGLRWNTRYRWLTDMNRLFTARPNDRDALEILRFFSKCDVIIDFHEGWGFHQISPDSLGSTIMPNSTVAAAIAKQIVDDLNLSSVMQSVITQDPKKAWVAVGADRPCEIPTTLSCYLQRHSAPKHHILVETTGQGDIQPKNIRCEQVRVIIESLLRYHDMI